MKATRVKFKGADVTVSELTVTQLESAVESSKSFTMIDRIFDSEVVTQSMLEQATGLSGDELRSSYPSEIRLLVDGFKEVNPDFLSGMAAVEKRVAESK